MAKVEKEAKITNNMFESQYEATLFKDLIEYDEFKVPPSLEEAIYHSDCTKFGRKNPEKQGMTLKICPCCARVQDELYPLCTPTDKLDSCGTVIPQYFHLLKFLILVTFLISFLTLVCNYSIVKVYCKDHPDRSKELLRVLCPPSNSNIILSPVVTPVMLLLMVIMFFFHHTRALHFVEEVDCRKLRASHYTIMMFNMFDKHCNRQYIQQYLDAIMKKNGCSQVHIAKISYGSIHNSVILLEREIKEINTNITWLVRHLQNYRDDESEAIVYARKKKETLEISLQKKETEIKELKSEIEKDFTFQENCIAFVTLRYKEEIDRIVKYSTSSLMSSNWSFMGRIKLFQSEDDHPIERALDPDDIKWNNIGYSILKQIYLQRTSLMGTFIAVILSNLIQLLLMMLTTKLELTARDNEMPIYLKGLIKLIQISASVLTALSNLGLILVLVLLSFYEKPLSQSQWILGLIRKLVFFQFINGALVAIMVNISPSTFGGNPNLKDYIFNMLVVNMVIGPLTQLFDPFHYIKLLKRRGVYNKIKSREFIDYNQKELNALFEPADCAINARYTGVCRTFYLSCFFFEIVPSCMFVCVVYFLLQYWIDKVMILRRYRKSTVLNGQLGLRIGEMAEVGIVLISLGRIYSRLQTRQPVGMVDYLCFGFSVAVTIVPMLGYAILTHNSRREKKQRSLEKRKMPSETEDTNSNFQSDEVLNSSRSNRDDLGDDSMISERDSRHMNLQEEIIDIEEDRQSYDPTYDEMIFDFETE